MLAVSHVEYLIKCCPSNGKLVNWGHDAGLPQPISVKGERQNRGAIVAQVAHEKIHCSGCDRTGHFLW